MCVCVTPCVCVCVFCLLCFFHNFGMRSERKRTDFHLSASFAKKKKKSPSCDSNICFSHLSIALPPCLSLSLSSIAPSLSKWHLRMTRASRVSGAEGGIGGAGGKKKKRGERERKRKREQAPLTSHFPSTTPACQPACSLFSFELSILPQHRKKKSIHISIIHTPVCLHVFASPPPSMPLPFSLFLSPSLSLPFSPGVD